MIYRGGGSGFQFASPFGLFYSLVSYLIHASPVIGGRVNSDDLSDPKKSREYTRLIHEKMQWLSRSEALDRALTLLGKIQSWSDAIGPFIDGPMLDLMALTWSTDGSQELASTWFEQRKMSRLDFILAVKKDDVLARQFSEFKHEYFNYIGSFEELTLGESPGHCEHTGDPVWEVIREENGFWASFILTPKRENGKLVFSCELGQTSDDGDHDEDDLEAVVLGLLETEDKSRRRTIDLVVDPDSMEDTEEWPDDKLSATGIVVYVVFTDDRCVAADHVDGIDCMYSDEEDADEALGDYRRESDDYSGYPWMFNATWCPDERLTTEDLHSHGFSVAVFKPTENRYCGFDGSGDWDLNHFIPLFVEHYLDHIYVAERNTWPALEGYTPVMTADLGLVYVKKNS